MPTSALQQHIFLISQFLLREKMLSNISRSLSNRKKDHPPTRGETILQPRRKAVHVKTQHAGSKRIQSTARGTEAMREIYDMVGDERNHTQYVRPGGATASSCAHNHICCSSFPGRGSADTCALRERMSRNAGDRTSRWGRTGLKGLRVRELYQSVNNAAPEKYSPIASY